MRTVFVFFGIVALLAATSFFTYFFAIKIKANKESNTHVTPPMEVGAAKVIYTEVENFIELPARVVSREIAEVRPRISGIVKEVKFKEGSEVKAGDVLYIIDPNISVKDYKMAKIYSPISGTAGLSNFKVGSLVSVGQAMSLVTIANLEKMQIEAVYSGATLDTNIIGGRFEIALNGKEYEGNGIIVASDVAVNRATNSIKIVGDVESFKGVLLPGMLAKIKLYMPKVKAIVLSQRHAIIDPSGSMFVWVIGADGTLAKRPVKTGGVMGANWIITEGLQEGDLIATEGFQRFFEGFKVKGVLAEELK